jgi:translation initiation factor IF-2
MPKNNKFTMGGRERFSNPNANKPRIEGGKYIYKGSVTAGDLANALGLKMNDILKELFLAGKAVNINSALTDDEIAEICINHGFDFEKEVTVAPDEFEKIKSDDDPKDLVERAPIVTIMGHVDHGKTTLIDTIRNSHIADKEAGLITQEIGAYQKVYNGKKITFLDTPGHEAFSAMRQRGAQVTDIVVLVVAADDGVMPQTVEAIDHAKAANVPIIVAINKIDKPGANPDKVMSELGKYELVPEQWGGTTIMKNISAKKNIGINDLLENILLLAEMKELKANPKRLAAGTVIESTMDAKVGPKATLLVQNGTLHVGDCLVVGHAFCKVRRMTNEFNKAMASAGPSTPVSIIGLSEVPEAGDQFRAFATEKEAKQIAEARLLRYQQKDNANENEGITISNVYDKIAAGEMTALNLIIKGDTEGSVQAIKDSVGKKTVEGVTAKVIHAASGDVTEGDVILASASHGITVAFNVKTNALVAEKAKEMKVEIRNYDIIYHFLDDLEQAMRGLLKPVTKEVIFGHAQVGATFKASKVGVIAGCRVIDGFIRRSGKMRVLRNGAKILDSTITSFKIGKDDVGEVKQGFECGIVLADYKDVQVGDVLECWGTEEVKADDPKAAASAPAAKA